MKTEVVKVMSVELECVEKALINKVWELLDSIAYKMHDADVEEVTINGTNFDLESLNNMANLLYDMR